VSDYDDALKAGGTPVETDYDRALKAGASTVTEPPPGVFDRFTERLGRGFGRLADTVIRGGSTLAGIAADEARTPLGALSLAVPAPPLQLLHIANMNPARRRELERGLSDVTTLGLAEKAGAKVGGALGETGLTPQQAEVDALAEPGVRQAGQFAGSFLPSPINYLTGKVGQAIPGKGAIPGAVRGIAQYEAVVPGVTALTTPGTLKERGQAALDAATDPFGLLLSGGAGATAGAISKAAETGPERVFKRAKKDITTGEQNAGIGKVRKLERATGPDDEKLRELFGRDPDLYKTIATKAKTNPAKALKAVDVTMADKADRLDELYGQMSKAHRAVAPTDVAIEFDKILADRLRQGDLPAVGILRRERAQFLSEYGNVGHLDVDTMRGLKATAGQRAFEGMPIPGNVKRDIWNVYAGAIERQAKGSGVNIGELRGLNRDMSVLIPAKDALQERATAQAAGRLSIGSHIGHAALAGAGFAHGGIKEAIVGALLPEAAKVGQQLARRADFALSEGASVPAIGGQAARLYAASVSRKMNDGMSLADAVTATDEEK
jgi:hypothetical protein